MHFVDGSQVHVWIGHQGLEFFLCAFCRSGSACATMGRGLRKRNPNCLNSLWLWRTPKRVPNWRLIHAARVLPSHKLPFIPTSLGVLRRTASTSANRSEERRVGKESRARGAPYH